VAEADTRRADRVLGVDEAKVTRHTKFIALRDDKPAREVLRE